MLQNIRGGGAILKVVELIYGFPKKLTLLCSNKKSKKDHRVFFSR